MTGVTFPAAMNSPRMRRSPCLDCAINVANFWLTKHDSKGPAITRPKNPNIHRPPGLPAAMYLPLRFKIRLQADNEWFAKQSKNKS